jgi:hypothetical protein
VEKKNKMKKMMILLKMMIIPGREVGNGREKVHKN